MTTCQACDAAATLYLCTTCETDLADKLTALVTGGTITEVLQSGRTASHRPWRIERTRRIPGIIQDLEDAATGQTRFAGTQRHTSSDEAPLRFNTNAREIINDIRTELQTWNTILAKHTGVAYHPINWTDNTGYAMWLADHTHQLAGIDSIGKFHRRLTHLTKRAQRCVDRPPSPRFCGQCDTMIDRKICGLALYAHRDAIEVTCPNPKCRTTHNIEKLYNRTLNNADNKLFPREVLIGNQRTDSPERYTTGIMGELGEFVHWQAFHHWVKQKHLKPRMYLRPNGRRGFYRHSPDDVPEYRLADVRKVKRQMDQKTGKTAKTG